jgi:RNA polymerase sigma factor (sigma-70 family)
VTAQPPLDRQPDAALLSRFAKLRDDEAFAELMRRHGPLVLAVCRRLLRQRQDAEDAFQAAFLALARQARALRRVRSLAGWLHNVAFRVSCNLRRANRRHHERMQALRERRQDSTTNPLIELQDVLDEELTALPARYREAIVLCDLQGHTREEAARRLAAPVATVGTWLSRGRNRLKERLQRRGVTLGVGSVAAALAPVAEASTPSVELISERFTMQSYSWQERAKAESRSQQRLLHLHRECSTPCFSPNSAPQSASSLWRPPWSSARGPCQHSLALDLTHAPSLWVFSTTSKMGAQRIILR